VRLQAYLAHCGVASRRASEELILAGRVSVNGIIVTTLGTKVSGTDTVLLDGKPVHLEQKKHYIALHKPAGYICSAHDPRAPLAQELLHEDITERVYTIGRLDFPSSGLILFTNDGVFAAALGTSFGGTGKGIHSRFHGTHSRFHAGGLQKRRGT